MLITIISNHQFQQVSSLCLENNIAWRVLKIFSKEESDFWEIGWFFVMLSPKAKLRKCMKVLNEILQMLRPYMNLETKIS